MRRIRINGRRQLKGLIPISGAKNAVLKLMAAALMAPGESVIHNVPHIQDVFTMVDLLKTLGVGVQFEENTLRLAVGEQIGEEAPHELVRKMRASIQVMGPLLGRLGRVRVSLPGGCAIGERPIDFHLKGFKQLGAQIREEHGYIYAEVKELRGVDIQLDYPSVGATENLMMAAALAKGTTQIRNAAREPEIIEVQNFLNQMGARIRGAGTDVIRIDGVETLHPAEHTVIPDRIEAGTYMVAGAIAGGEVTLQPVIPQHVSSLIAKLEEAGIEVSVEDDKITVYSTGSYRAVNFQSLPYPGFPTDLLPQVMAMMTLAKGTSVIRETVYTNRYKHVSELRRMGANIILADRSAVVQGVSALSGAEVVVPDLRAGAALVLAGLGAHGTTIVEDDGHLDRGYDNLVGKLQGVGAEIGFLE
ncbi:MAG: UDP-N-acetylglucosamine 1-carboxyvinyltransferase [Firmicutes bacterium]|nr:UDP-N-acetylglucosamine 1-carboxyvinyltransferase [Bacillota bacterium]